MQAKEYLLQIIRADENIRAKHNEIETLREKAVSLQFEIKERVQSSPVRDKMGSIVAQIVDLEAEYVDDIAKAVKLRAKIIDEIDTLEDVMYRKILIMRYIEHKTFENMAFEIDKSFQWTHKLHSRALKYFEENILS